MDLNVNGIQWDSMHAGEGGARARGHVQPVPVLNPLLHCLSYIFVIICLVLSH